MSEIKDKEGYYNCISCSYRTKRKADLRRHLLSVRHIDRVSDIVKSKEYTCICGSRYVHQSGLSRHKLQCKEVKEIINGSGNGKEDIKNEVKIVEQANLLTEVLKHMEDLKHIVPMQSVNTTNNYNIVNLNVFLNEKCRDAISIDEFIKQLSFVFDDLRDGAWRSKIFLNNLGNLQVEDRPFHCLDGNEAQVVVKDKGGWKNGGRKDIEETLDSCGREIQRNFGPKWDKENPDWTKNEKQHKAYMKILHKITAEPSEAQVEKELNNITRELTLPQNSIKQLKD